MFKKDKKHKDSGISTEGNSTENGGGKDTKKSPERRKRNRMSSGGSVDSRNETSGGNAEMSSVVASGNNVSSLEASPVRPADRPTAKTNGDQQTSGEGQWLDRYPLSLSLLCSSSNCCLSDGDLLIALTLTRLPPSIPPSHLSFPARILNTLPAQILIVITRPKEIRCG